MNIDEDSYWEVAETAWEFVEYFNLGCIAKKEYDENDNLIITTYSGNQLCICEKNRTIFILTVKSIESTIGKLRDEYIFEEADKTSLKGYTGIKKQI